MLGLLLSACLFFAPTQNSSLETCTKQVCFTSCNVLTGECKRVCWTWPDPTCTEEE